MTKYPCPVCNRRICDSGKKLYLTRSGEENARTADLFIKCQNCKNTIAVEVIRGIEYGSPCEETFY